MKRTERKKGDGTEDESCVKKTKQEKHNKKEGTRDKAEAEHANASTDLIGRCERGEQHPTAQR